MAILSILHRITGAGLALGAVVVAAWLVSAYLGDDAFAVVQTFRDSIIGQIMLFCWLLAFCYHLVNGLRHLVWDFAVGLELKTARLSSWVVIIVALALTAFLWCKVGGA